MLWLVVIWSWQIDQKWTNNIRRLKGWKESFKVVKIENNLKSWSLIKVLLKYACIHTKSITLHFNDKIGIYSSPCAFSFLLTFTFTICYFYTWYRAIVFLYHAALTFNLQTKFSILILEFHTLTQNVSTL